MLQMGKIFIGLAFWNVVLFGGTIWLGVTHQSAHWQHQAMGVLTGIYTCFTHCVVMMHFMGSGKGIKEAVETYALPNDPQDGYVRRTRRFKGRTSGHATLCCLFIIVTVWLGGWMDTHKLNPSAPAGTWDSRCSRSRTTSTRSGWNTTSSPRTPR